MRVYHLIAGEALCGAVLCTLFGCGTANSDGGADERSTAGAPGAAAVQAGGQRDTESAASEIAPIVLPAYGCVGTAPVTRGLSVDGARKTLSSTGLGGVYLRTVMPFVGADGIQRIALLYHEGGDEYGAARLSVRERGPGSSFRELYTEKVDGFSRHYLTLVDADRDGNYEVVYDGYDGGSGAYLYRTVLYCPGRGEAFFQESSWSSTGPGNGSVFVRSDNLKARRNRDIRKWFDDNVHGGPAATGDGGLKRPCGDAVLERRSAFHRGRECGNALLPVYAGLRWLYRRGSGADPEKSETWELSVLRIPNGDTPGAVSAGPSTDPQRFSLFNRDGNLRIDGLGDLAPREFEEIHEVRFDGETLPRVERFIDGAVWEYRAEREVTYRIADKEGVLKKQKGVAEERHRALAGEMETVRVPAGKFVARKILWSSRVKLRTDGRPVLTPLTAAPYRTEVMWVAPCVGIVKRSVTFPLQNETVIYELLSGPSSSF